MNIEMLNNIQFGILNRAPIHTLYDVIEQIYDPLMKMKRASRKFYSFKSENLSHSDHSEQDNEYDDLPLLVSRFLDTISRTVSQLESEVLFKIPQNLFLSENLEENLENRELLKKIVDLGRQWKMLLQKALDDMPKTASNPSPMAEIEYWRERYSALNNLHEQLNVQDVKNILTILNYKDKTIGTIKEELSKFYTEAKDNVRFLSTLDRHFKNLAHSNFYIISYTIPSMLNTLRMIWIISRHYNQEKRMIPLLEKIAWQLIERVEISINYKTLFNEPVETILNKTSQARDIFTTWKESYFEVRALIEESNRESRWEFDRKKLFEKTDYMSRICQDLFDFAQTIQEFNNIFGPELKALTGNTKGIDNGLNKVKRLIQPLQELDFNFFDSKYKNKWKQLKNWFHFEVDAIEIDTKSLVDYSFKNLRSAEAAFDLLIKFECIRSRRSINEKMKEKMTDIIIQYGKEIDEIEKIFHRKKNTPPKIKDMTNTSGIIFWERLLFRKIKRTMLKFLSMDNLSNSDLLKLMKQKYLTVAKQLKSFEDEIYEQWKDNSENIIINLMRQSILSSPKHTIYIQDDDIKATFEVNFNVEFDPALKELIVEIKQLELMGFKIPELLRSLALQETHYLKKVDAMKSVIDRLKEITDRLDDDEKLLLANHINQLRNVFKPGLKRLNWCSLGVEEFILSCRKAIEQFESIGQQVLKIVDNISTKVNILETVKLCPNLYFGDPNDLTSRNYFLFVKKQLDDQYEILNRKYLSISQQLIKLESVIFRTNTGRRPEMKEYYRILERKLYRAVRNNICQNLKRLIIALKEPKFSLRAILTGSDVVLSPTAAELYKEVRQFVISILDDNDLKCRWQHGSCLECPPQKLENVEEEFIFSYYDDIINDNNINELANLIHCVIRNYLIDIQEYIRRWRKWRTLWRTDKETVFELWISKCPRFVQFDEKLLSYQSMINDLCILPKQRDIGCIRLLITPLTNSVIHHCRLWLKLYSNALYQQAKDEMKNIYEMICIKYIHLEEKPISTEKVMFILNIISNIQSSFSDQLAIIKITQEKYRMLKSYQLIQLTPLEDYLINQLDKSWEELLEHSKGINRKMITVKYKFRKITRERTRKFLVEVHSFTIKFDRKGPNSIQYNLDEGLNLLNIYKKEFDDLEKRKLEIVKEEKLFDLKISNFQILINLEKKIGNLLKIFHLYIELKRLDEIWSKILWIDLNLQSFSDNLFNIIKKFKQLSENIKQLNPSRKLLKLLDDYKELIPLFKELKNETIRERHWLILMEKTGENFNISPDCFCLKNIFDMNIHNIKSEIYDLVNGAIREQNIEKSIKSIEELLNNLKLNIIEYKRSKKGDKYYIFNSIEDTINLLEEQSINLQSISSSKFVRPFLRSINELEKVLMQISEVLDIWLVVQKKWLHLEAIFCTKDIRRQIPNEASKFDKHSNIFHEIMKTTRKDSNAKNSCLLPGRMDILVNLDKAFDTCQRYLNDYLDIKRQTFPRFYFLSDNELLSILGGVQPNSILEHVSKVFDNVSSLSFDQSFVKSMLSGDEEELILNNSISSQRPIEDWMNDLIEEMKTTNHKLIKLAIFNYCCSKVRIDWINEYQGAICLAASQVWRTWEIEDTFTKLQSNKNAMKSYLNKLETEINDLVQRILESIPENNRKKLNCLIIVDIHSRDIVNSLIRDNIVSGDEFEWESQLRFYWDKNTDNLIVNQCTGSFQYGYEYFGLAGRLVITPLTDRIYLTFTQALSMHLGGAPFGPAGTGKTETVKDLARALGLLCIVTNCSEGLDFKSIGKLLSGLCQCGCWGCFDEFNRINISVLSVISTQLTVIRQASIMNLKQFFFEGYEIMLRKNMGIFVTMNPCYSGRTELPESLKALFRPVVVMQPDIQQICQILLFSQGFHKAKQLAWKLVVLYDMSREQLSKQHHYDFGLRSIKVALLSAGKLKRKYQNRLTEELVLMKSLRDINLPKLINQDIELFNGLLSDLFPGLESPSFKDDQLDKAITESLIEQNLQIVANQIDKIKQFHQMISIRHSTMIVGPTNGGKSVIIKTLSRAYSKLGLRTKLSTINPKDRPVIELYGILDPSSRQWTDGLLSTLFREANKPCTDVNRNWIIFDGDVDAIWIENMNSVMDDNRLLTLANGERIKLVEECSLIFEVGDLQYASPATVSRCGMVFVEPDQLGYKPYWQSWLDKRPVDEQKEILKHLYNKYIDPLISYIFDVKRDERMGDRPNTIVKTDNVNMMDQLCYLLSSLLKVKEKNEMVIEAIFLQAIYWSFGATVMKDDQVKFDYYVKHLTHLPPNDNPIEVIPGYIPKAEKTLYDYYFDYSSRLWIPWINKVKKFSWLPGKKFKEILVPTIDTERADWLLNIHLRTNRRLLFVGETGSCKTATISDFLRSLDNERYTPLTMNFSSSTTSYEIQKNLEANTEKRTKNTLGPTLGKSLVVFIDDMNIPLVDNYGTQEPIAFLRLLFDEEGYYGRGNDSHWIHLKDIDFIAAMGKSGGGRNEINSRFLSRFSVINMTLPSDSSLFHIYSSILNGHLEGFSKDIQNSSSKITTMSINLYKNILASLLPTPTKFHYIFSLRDISRLYSGILSSSANYFKTLPQFLRLWRNECKRTFNDRLITTEDIEYVNNCIEASLDENFSNDLQDVLSDPILFGYYANNKFYQDSGNYGNVLDILNDILIDFYQLNDEKFVLFDYAIEHLTRLHRILSLDEGNALLIGFEGSGRRTIAKIACYISHCDLFEISLKRGYNEANFREDLKVLYKRLGLENKKIALFLTDNHILEEGFLEIINCILSTGNLQILFEEDEKDAIINQIRDEAISAGWPSNYELIWTYFSRKSASNLHTILCMSPAGDSLRNRCRNFPALINNMSMDWYLNWPKEALVSIAKSYVDLSDDHVAKLLKDSINDIQKKTINHMVIVHESSLNICKEYFNKFKKINFVTQKHYLDFIKTFTNLLQEKCLLNFKQSKRLSDGMMKLVEASNQIKGMNKQLEWQKSTLRKKTKKCDSLLSKLSEKSTVVEDKKKLTSIKANELDVQSSKLEVEKKEAELALASALPALEEARLALSNLRKDDVREIRSFAKPVYIIQRVCESIVVLNGIKEVSWRSAKTMMSEANFLKNLKDINVDNITNKQLHNVKLILKDPEMNLENMKEKSRAGYGLLQFVLAVVDYCEVYREIRPKRDRVEKLEKNFKNMKKDLDRLNLDLNFLEQENEKLKKMFEDANLEKMKLQKEAAIMERRLKAAKKLFQGLGSENERWTIEYNHLQDQRDKLIGDCLLSAAFLSYSSPFNPEFRQKLMKDIWINDLTKNGILYSKDFTVQNFLTNDVEVSHWISEGLPSDELSIENGILATKSSKFSLCIDPQQQAYHWIIKREKKNNLKICSSNDTDFLKQLELALKYGYPFLVKNLDENIDPIINNLLENGRNNDFNRKLLLFGDKEIEMDPNFRLYLNTNLSNPKFRPCFYSNAVVINYTVTTKGLEDQLLSVIVQFEKNELEDQKKRLIRETSENKRYLKDFENSLLRELSNSTGNMLDNSELLSTLENTKLKANEISDKLKLASKNTIEIDQLRDAYRPAAKRGAILFFILDELSLVNPMYQYSLNFYLEVFDYSLRKSMPDMNLKKRIENIKETLTYNVYLDACIGIFEKHKILFSFQIAAKLEADAGRVTDDEIEFFIRGNTEFEKTNDEENNPPFKWVPYQCWKDCCYLSKKFPNLFETLLENITDNEITWNKWYKSKMTEKLKFPTPFDKGLSLFQQLLLLRCFRVDRVYAAVTNYVVKIMGEKFVTSPIVNLENILERSNPNSPVVFILNPGATPISKLEQLAESIKYIGKNRLKALSLGQGQECTALSLLEIAISRGQWLLLQNCHLLLGCLDELEKYLQKVTNPHPHFRLWLTTAPVNNFPLSILRRSLKVVTEAPYGLKLNLRHTYSRITTNLTTSCSNSAFHPLLFVLAFFHGVVQERRKYGKIGWNVPYEFNESDFLVASNILSIYLNKLLKHPRLEIPWNSLKFLIGQITYGGRVTDSYDRRIIATYMDEYMGDFIFEKIQSFYFYKDSSICYKIPEPSKGQRAHKQMYVDYIESLPLTNSPEVYGLSLMAEIGYYTDATRDLWRNLAELRPTIDNKEYDLSVEDRLERIVDEILNQLPNLFGTLKLKGNLDKTLKPIAVVLFQELERFNLLREKIFRTLSELKRAIKGEDGMNEELDEVSSSLINDQIPNSWKRLAPETRKSLADWIIHLKLRSVQYLKWVEEEIQAIWLSGLHSPKSYLLSLIQSCSRYNGWSLDKSTFYTIVTDFKSTERLEEHLRVERSSEIWGSKSAFCGGYVTGLYLVGAGWDIERNTLKRIDPREFFTPLPILKIVPIEIHRLKLQNTIKTPVYVTSYRSNRLGDGLVFEADLHTTEHPSHAILKGLYLTLNKE
ncbi:DgyrCDS10220 [Dimorphilus gyrociliatus]|uniref:DgyrCDS10220 n=1 Tax=Dimorphilus gyrociliatus TaxID=2664684 RepID=A0A7I8W4N1_9ANNE|nr:DgyrCDS10220 [Dimorphilus gyrociliatus]